MTNNDGIGNDGPELAALRAAAQDRDAGFDPRWPALAEGRLSEDEVRELREQAHQTEDGRRLWELYRPFDSEEKERLFEGVCQRLQRHRK